MAAAREVAAVQHLCSWCLRPVICAESCEPLHVDSPSLETPKPCRCKIVGGLIRFKSSFSQIDQFADLGVCRGFPA
jgi:hypothetical protein